MKITFASILLASCCVSAAALAETSHADWLACDEAATTGQASANCSTLRVVYFDRVSACMAQRKKTADMSLGSSLANGSHTNRARYLLCAAEVQDGMGIAAK